MTASDLYFNVPTQRGTRRKYRVYPSLVGLHGQTRVNARQQIRRSALKTLGLTVRGTRPVKRGWLGSLGGLTGKARRREILSLNRRANYVAGRTARGTPRRRFTKPFTVTIP